MSLLSFIRKPRARTSPHANRMSVPVSVTTPKAQACVIDNEPAPLEFTRDPKLAAQIRNNLPNRPVSHELRACRMAAVLDKQAAFLADASGKVEPPERWEVIDACLFAAEFMRDGIVVGSVG
jgi:hypothetical protein